MISASERPSKQGLSASRQNANTGNPVRAGPSPSSPRSSVTQPWVGRARNATRLPRRLVERPRSWGRSAGARLGVAIPQGLAGWSPTSEALYRVQQIVALCVDQSASVATTQSRLVRVTWTVTSVSATSDSTAPEAAFSATQWARAVASGGSGAVCKRPRPIPGRAGNKKRSLESPWTRRGRVSGASTRAWRVN